jgi:hypothetical protein
VKSHMLASAVAGLAAALALSAPAQAARILDFSSACGGAASCSIGQDYGDDAQVNISYRTVDGETGETVENFLRFAETGFGDLQGAAYGGGGEYYAEIVFNAADGYELSLASFDFAGLAARTRAFFEIYALDGSPVAAVAYRTPAGHGAASFESDYRNGLVLRWKPSADVAVDNIAFDIRSMTAVPEPGTWALMIAGFGLAGAALRRRNRALAAAA